MEDIDWLQHGHDYQARKALIPAYGASQATDGDDTYTFTDNSVRFTASTADDPNAGLNVSGSPGKYVMTIWDSGGTDTIDASTLSTRTYIDLRAGHFSAIGTDKNEAPGGADLNNDNDPDGDTNWNVGIAYNAEIENAKGGSGADLIIGNNLGNKLEGGGQSDTLKGGVGNDTLEGGSGSDSLDGGTGNDTYVWNTGDGIDTIVDSDGHGRIILNGATLTGGEQVGESVWSSADRQHTFVLLNGNLASGGDLLIDGKVTVMNFHTGALGLSFQTIDFPGSTATGGGDFEELDTGYYQISTVIEGGAGREIIVGFFGDDWQWAESRINNPVALYNSLHEAGDNQLGSWLSGGPGSDTLVGSHSKDILVGGPGADVIYGGAGDDLISSELWFTPIIYWHPPATVTIASQFQWSYQIDGGAYEYAITTVNGVEKEGVQFSGSYDHAEGQATLFGGSGNDFMDGGDRNDHLSGDEGDDTLVGAGGDDFLVGAAGNDRITGERYGYDAEPITWTDANHYQIHPRYVERHGNDTLYGGAGNDTLTGEGGDDQLYGGDDDDVLYGDESRANYDGDLPDALAGDDTLDGGAGSDTLYGDRGNDSLVGGGGSDVLVGQEGQDVLYGGDGNDILAGEAGADELHGGDGADELHGDAYGLPLEKQGGDRLFGEAGNDYLGGYAGDDYLDGGAGDDELHGDEGNDTAFGGEGADWIQTGIGDDYLSGGDGADILIGEGGDDTLDGGAGNNSLDGGDGNDLLIASGDQGRLNGGNGNDLLLGGAGNDTLYGEAGADSITGGDGLDVLDGGNGADTLWGGKGNDRMAGEAGDDLLHGQEGNDLIFGNSGNDNLLGDDGNDQIYGGDGEDTLGGGAGNDTLIGDMNWSTNTGQILARSGYLQDTYLFNLGDGSDMIGDIAVDYAPNLLKFGDGITLDKLKLSVDGDGLWINIAGTNDRVSIGFVNPWDLPLQYRYYPKGLIPGVGLFEFSDGTRINYNDLIRQGFEFTGSGYVSGTPDADRLSGTGTLAGGFGDDVYIYRGAEV